MMNSKPKEELTVVFCGATSIDQHITDCIPIPIQTEEGLEFRLVDDNGGYFVEYKIRSCGWVKLRHVCCIDRPSIDDYYNTEKYIIHYMINNELNTIKKIDEYVHNLVPLLSQKEDEFYEQRSQMYRDQARWMNSIFGDED